MMLKLNKEKIEKYINFTDDDAINDAYDWYDWGMIAVTVASLLPLTTHKDCRFFWYIEIFATLIFIIDYVLRWVTAKSRSRFRDWKAYAVYPFTLGAVIDLLTILPLFLALNPVFRALRVWRMMRIFRVARLFRYYEPLQMVINVFRKKAKMLLIVVGFAVFYILITALIMFNVEDTSNNADTHFFDTYWDAVYWATCTLTTVGYGDVYPISMWGRIISMISALVGIAIIALPSSILTTGYLEEVEEEKRKQQNSKDL